MAKAASVDLRSLLRELLENGVEPTLQTQDADSGRFLASNGGWAVTLQDVVLPLALLWSDADSPRHQDDRLLKACDDGVRALLDWQNPDGTFEFIKPDGSRWGAIHMPWTIYHWVETFVLLRDALDGATRDRWEAGLRLAYQGVAKLLQTPQGHNIPTWHGMSLTRASQVFGEAGWGETGRRQIEFAATHQHPHGFWAEGDGPATGYHHVYLHALGLYHAFTGDRSVIRALRQGAGFATTFAYPSGESVETVDGRQG